ncbi:hypothetical protein E24_00492 [Faustovirus]|nr:hypothetical protein PRJ_Fausto_00461 [Faustovirus]AMN83405.1 hypothetical protein E24_00492 [Faustovirus]AMN84387.1 hypothetical protein D5a_00490 [Faustovirus]AMN85375.1 hypothetical protein E23_00492 [Faustovirus]QBR99366.1 hypothetical protein [Faustovirus mariensis]
MMEQLWESLPKDIIVEIGSKYWYTWVRFVVCSQELYKALIQYKPAMMAQSCRRVITCEESRFFVLPCKIVNIYKILPNRRPYGGEWMWLEYENICYLNKYIKYQYEHTLYSLNWRVDPVNNIHYLAYKNHCAEGSRIIETTMYDTEGNISHVVNYK